MLAGTALSVGSQLFSQEPATPAPKIPAPPAPDSKQPGATVRVGANEGKTDTTESGYVGFTEKRKSGKALGGLEGRGGLTI